MFLTHVEILSYRQCGVSAMYRIGYSMLLMFSLRLFYGSVSDVDLRTPVSQRKFLHCCQWP